MKMSGNDEKLSIEKQLTLKALEDEDSLTIPELVIVIEFLRKEITKMYGIVDNLEKLKQHLQIRKIRKEKLIGVRK